MYCLKGQFLYPHRIDIKSSPPQSSTSNASLPVVCGHCGPHSEGPESGGAESVGGTFSWMLLRRCLGSKMFLFCCVGNRFQVTGF